VNSFGIAFAHVRIFFVDEESTWHKSNRGIEQKHYGFYAKTTQKGGFSKLCVKRKKKMLYRPTPFFNT
jgi:hypothetical protein